MTKRALAVLPLLLVLTFALGGSGTTPSAAAPTTPSLAAPAAPDSCAAPEPGFGSCRWYCGSRSYTTQSQCQANCGTECEQIC